MKQICIFILTCSLFGWGVPQTMAQESTEPIETRTDNNPIEIGKIEWGRDLAAAYQQSKESGKPVLLLFQEVPG